MPVPRRLTLQHPFLTDPRVHAGLLAGAFAGWTIAILWSTRPVSLLEPWQ